MQQIGENVCPISNSREIKIYFIVKLTFAYYKFDVLSQLHGNYKQDI